MKTFIDVAQMKLASLKEGQFVETGGEVVKGDIGAARYLVVDGTVAGSKNETLASGNTAVFQYSGATNNLDIINLQQGQTAGVIVFATYALLDAYTPTTAQESASFKVTNDPTSSLNGYYAWVSGTTYTKDADLANGVIELGNTDATSGDTVFKVVRDNTLNFMTFVTSEADRNKINGSGESTNQDDAAMKVYFDNFFNYIKANDIKSAVIPAGTYRFDKVTINNVKNLDLFCAGAKFYWNSGDSTLEMQACQRVNFHDGVWTSVSLNSYVDVIYIRIQALSAFIKFKNVRFTEWSRGAILIKDLAGGASSEGVDVIDCDFEDADDYDNVLQTAVTFENDGEYSRIMSCRFKDVPAAARFVNGANGMFKDNICLSMNGKETDASFLNAVVFCDASGSNNGKIDIQGNKMNHNPSGIAQIVVKGTNSLQFSSRLINNDLLINGSATQGASVYFDAVRGALLQGNKANGNSLGGAMLSNAFTLNNCPDATIENTTSIQFNVGIALTNGSTNVTVGKQLTDNVNTNTTVDGTSSIAP